MARSSRNLPVGTFDFFITARCINKEWFRIPLPDVWDLFGRYLYFISYAYEIRIRAFILMNNHFHLLVTCDSSQLPLAMNYLMRECSKEINKLSGRINQVWGRPYHSSVVLGFVHYQNVYKYLYRNAVDAGICEKVEEYPYSTLRGILGATHLLIPVNDEMLFSDLEGQLIWLNIKPTNENYRSEIRKALRGRIFKFGKITKKDAHPLDTSTI